MCNANNKIKSKLMLDFPKKENFNVPNGIHIVEIKDIYSLQSEDGDDLLRVKWRVLDMSHPTDEYVVAKTFQANLDPGTELRKFLEAIITSFEIAELLQGKFFDLEKLIGKRHRMITMATHGGKGHKSPFVAPKRMLPLEDR